MQLLCLSSVEWSRRPGACVLDEEVPRLSAYILIRFPADVSSHVLITYNLTSSFLLVEFYGNF